MHIDGRRQLSAKQAHSTRLRRKGTASDHRSEGWQFESLSPQRPFCQPHDVACAEAPEPSPGIEPGFSVYKTHVALLRHRGQCTACRQLGKWLANMPAHHMLRKLSHWTFSFLPHMEWTYIQVSASEWSGDGQEIHWALPARSSRIKLAYTVLQASNGTLTASRGQRAMAARERILGARTPAYAVIQNSPMRCS